MKVVSFRIGSTPGYGFSDFHLGRYQLAKRLGIKLVSSVDVDPQYARQLLLLESSAFPSGRVPLYVCECCADLNCGALTVNVESSNATFIWSHFAYEVPYVDRLAQSTAALERTGSFSFEAMEYRSALAPYALSRK